MNTNQTEKNTKKANNHKKLTITIILIVIILAISLLLYFIYQKYNAQGQIEQFEKNVENNDYKQIANTLSSNEHEFTTKEAQNFVKYVKKDNNFKQFQKEINNIKKNIKKDKQYSVKLGEITDNKDKTILSIKKDGKKYFFLDKITFEPQLYPVYVKEYSNNAIYEYELGKKVKTSTEKNSISKVGDFFVGKYSIDTKKTIKDNKIIGEVNGQLFFNTENRNNDGKIIADDSFNQGWFKAKTNAKKLLDDNSIKLMINDQEEEYNPNKVYGKYPLENKTFNIQAIGKIDDKVFKSETISLNRNGDNQPQNINLKFDLPKIKRYKHDTEDIKKEAKSFLEDYMDHLNKAYDKGDYDYIKNDIDKGTELAKRIKKETKHKQKINYKIKSFDTIERSNNKLNIKLTKSNNDYTTTGTYTLKFDYKNQFKITDYKD